MRIPRLSSTRARVAGGIVAAAVLVPTTAALAVVAGFNDVPDDHTHASGIQWVADNDITSGCTPTEYCPSAPVTRAQMATFMQRLAGHAAGVSPSVDADSVDGLDAAALVNPFGYATGTSSFSTADAPWVDVPGASTTITVPAGTTGTVVATFSAESVCWDGTGYCTARIIVDGTPAEPAAGTDFAFDSTDGDTEGSGSWESKTMQQVLGGLAPGNHTIQVQVGTTGTSTLRLDDWSLTAVGHLG